MLNFIKKMIKLPKKRQNHEKSKKLRFQKSRPKSPLAKNGGVEKHRFLGVRIPSNNTACVFFAKKEAKKGVSIRNRPNTSDFF